MKKALVAVLFPLIAHAQPTPQAQTCQTRGLAFTVALQSRDFGLTPQQALNRMHGMTAQGVTEGNLKKIINAVYFDPRLADAHGDELQYQATSLCMHPESAPKPLK